MSAGPTSDSLRDAHAFLIRAFDDLGRNDSNRVISWENGRRVERTHAQVSRDVLVASSRLRALEVSAHETISIFGPTCYDWLILDLACLRAGITTLAIPETVPAGEYLDLVARHSPAVQFVHADFEAFPVRGTVVYFGASRGSVGGTRHLHEIDPAPGPLPFSLPREAHYSIAFSSGTQGRHRILYIPYPDLGKSVGKLARPAVKGEAGRVMIWMSFTHYLQRWLSLQALMLGYDLVLSDPKHCLIHLAAERPTIMVCAPMLYHLLSDAIKRRLSRFGIVRRLLHAVYRKLRMNRRSRDDPSRQLFDRFVLDDVQRLYGGRADQFIWSGACIRREAIDVLDRVGLQVCGGYALSEIGPVSTDSVRTFRAGSVGKPNRQVRISEESEILVGVHAEMRDLRQLTIDDGFVCTGDLGQIDGDGYLFVLGRKDDLIILFNGKNIRPQRIEDSLCGTGEISEAFVFSRDNLRLSAAIVLTDPATGVEETARATAALGRANQRLRQYECIHDFCVVPQIHSRPDLMTGSQKIKRAAAARVFGACEFKPVARDAGLLA
jgi:long-subunit acyl-CoA synthetase (AMP-forming)